MTSPFQSIISTTPVGSPAAHLDEHHAFGEGVTEDLRADEQTPISIPCTETRDTGEQSVVADHVVTGLTTLPALRRSPLVGGYYSPEDALAVLNSHFFVGKSTQETAIFRINSDDTVAFLPPEQFKLEIQNIFVNKGTAKEPKLVPAEKYWREHPKRHQKKLVFKPGGTTDPCEHNLWRGFAVEPRTGWQKQRRFLRHILKIICRGHRDKFKYLIRWLAWAVQNPDKQAATVIVLKSRKQGTGKSTLGVAMLKIFGQHGALIDDSDRLLGRFNDWLERVSFTLAEEILWAGDHKTADRLKSRVTADTLQIERKNGAISQIPNRLHIIMTTNHDHAVGAGVGDRRFVVYDISDERACDKTWFDPIYRDLNGGGASEFLRFLQDVKLGDWHPRQILKTAETAEQQRMSGDSVSQWSQACIEADTIIGMQSAHGAVEYDLGQPIGSEYLRTAYAGYCKQHGLRPVSENAFGKACVEMFGPRKRLSAASVVKDGPGVRQTVEDVGAPSESDQALDQRVTQIVEQRPSAEEIISLARPYPPAKPDPAVAAGGKRRPWGYDVPDGDTWQEKIDARLGIQH